MLLLVSEIQVTAYPKHFSKEIRNGIEYIYCPRPNATNLHVLKIDLNHPNLEIKVAFAHGTIGKLDTVRNISKENNALAAVNATFFDNRKKHLPIGLIMLDGIIVTKNLLKRSSFGITANKKCIFGIPQVKAEIFNMANKEKINIWGINRPRKENEIILYTPSYGERTGTNLSGVELIIEENEVVGIAEGNSAIPDNGYVISFDGWTRNYANYMAPGTNIFVQFILSDEWEQATQIITGGPRLIENYYIAVDTSIIEENFKYNLLRKNARTAIGVTENNELILAVVEGGKKKLRRRGRTYRWGVSYWELAQIMLNLGAKNAIALDGGTTSTMYVDGKVVNRPAGNYERRVSNALIVKTNN